MKKYFAVLLLSFFQTFCGSDGNEKQGVNLISQNTSPYLLINEGPVFTFGERELGSLQEKTLNVLYDSAVPVDISISNLSPPFSRKGGTCGSRISGNCTIVITYSPTAVTYSETTLSITYKDKNNSRIESILIIGNGKGSKKNSTVSAPL